MITLKSQFDSDFPDTMLPSKARIFRMPGGEWHITPNGHLKGRQWAFVQCSSQGQDLLGLAVWADAVHRQGGETFIVMPYLPGARQDRYHPGEALTAKVYADIINSCEPSAVICLDPHSDVMPAMIKNCVVVPPQHFVKKAIQNDPPFDGVIAPDAGAVKRAQAVADFLGLPLYHAWKHRDPKTGKLSGFTCEPLPAGKRLLIVDDICDGGGTFKGLAKATGVPSNLLGLWVTHGIFSKGAKDLVDYFDAIYTTDSHESFSPDEMDSIHPKLRVVKVFDALTECIY